VYESKFAFLSSARTEVHTREQRGRSSSSHEATRDHTRHVNGCLRAVKFDISVRIDDTSVFRSPKKELLCPRSYKCNQPGKAIIIKTKNKKTPSLACYVFPKKKRRQAQIPVPMSRILRTPKLKTPECAPKNQK